MPVKRRVAKQRTYREISQAVWRWLTDEGEPNSQTDPEGFWEVFMLQGSELRPDGSDKTNELVTVWNQVREELLSEWAAEHPGTRPRMWWALEAPRAKLGTFRGCWYDDHLQEPRLLVGGTGRPAHEVLALMPSYEFGIPTSWMNLREDNPPVFESQAAYLKRHGLLPPAEARRLSAVDFEPEQIIDFKLWSDGRTNE
jgi:hypothetical protein